MELTLLIVIIVIALLFDLVNGFHDAANSIATVVSTKVLTPGQAVVWAAFFNVLAFWIFDMSVGNTVAKTVDNGAINLWVILAGLIAATIWNLLTWKLGIPSSSSHTLIGGFAGAAIAHAGFSVVNSTEILKVVAFIFLAPVIGGVISYIITIITIQRNPYKKIGSFTVLSLGIMYLMNHMVNYMDVKPIMMWIVGGMLGTMILFYIWYYVVHGKSQTVLKESNMYKKLQLLSSAAFSLGHGGADSQKVMGIIAAAMVSTGLISETKELPEWVPLACYSVIAFGTLFGGWKIVKTMGQKVTKLTPFEGFSAETAGAITLFGTQHFKIPVSTTHTITGCIIGVGVTKRVSAVRWGVTIELIWAWILTIPVSALMAALIYNLIQWFLP